MTHIVGIGGTLREKSRSRYALQRALQATENTGAKTTLLDLRELQLPMFEPDRAYEDYDKNVHHFVETMRQADGLIISTAAYHGAMAGVTKNALDFAEFLEGDQNTYFHLKAVGLIAVASGTMAGPNVITELVHVVHALRGTVVSFSVAIPRAGKVFDSNNVLTDETWNKRLEQLGVLTVQLAHLLRPEPVLS